jgi:hypothetical protein
MKNGGADPGAEGHHNDNARAIFPSAKVNLSQSRGVGIIGNGNGAARSLFKETLGISSNPGGVDVPSRKGDSVFDDSRKPDSDWTLPFKMLNNLPNCLGHGLRGCGTRCFNTKAFRDKGAGFDINDSTFDPGTANVDS